MTGDMPGAVTLRSRAARDTAPVLHGSRPPAGAGRAGEEWSPCRWVGPPHGGGQSRTGPSARDPAQPSSAQHHRTDDAPVIHRLSAPSTSAHLLAVLGSAPQPLTRLGS